jgi:hypothetical protein
VPGSWVVAVVNEVADLCGLFASLATSGFHAGTWRRGLATKAETQLAAADTHRLAQLADPSNKKDW